MTLKGYVGTCQGCMTPHLWYGIRPDKCVNCGDKIELHGQVIPLSILTPGIYHAVQDRRNYKRTNWQIFDNTGQVGNVQSLVALRNIVSNKLTIHEGVYPKYNGTSLDEFTIRHSTPAENVSINWFEFITSVDLEDI